jgi:hypothetical protein
LLLSTLKINDVLFVHVGEDKSKSKYMILFVKVDKFV